MDHSSLCFKPCGIKGTLLETVILLEDEMEALRLADFEGLYQEECAQKMNISRTTFSRVVTSARKKVSDALLNKKILEVKGETMAEKIVACNNSKCIKKDQCKRYDLFLKGAKEFTTNGGTPEKGCKKFIQK